MRMESANARLFNDWRGIREWISATPTITDDELGSACRQLYAIEDEMLTLPAETAEEVWRLVLIAVDAQSSDDNSPEAVLWRRASAAVEQSRAT